jgi:hypothetical protein
LQQAFWLSWWYVFSQPAAMAGGENDGMHGPDFPMDFRKPGIVTCIHP